MKVDRIKMFEKYIKACELASIGLSFREISKIIGVHPSTVRSWVKGYTHPLRKSRGKKSYSRDDYEKVIKLRENGLSSSKISELTGIPLSTVKEWIFKGGGKSYLAAKMKENQKRLREGIRRLYIVKVFDQFCKEDIKERKLIEKFFRLNNLPILSYLLGSLLTDGSITSGRVEYSGEKIFMERINIQLKKLLGRKYKIGFESNKWRLSITRKDFVKLMDYLSKNYRWLVEWDRRTIRMFILGVIDGDGTYDGRSTILLRITRRKWLIGYLQDLLKNLGVGAKNFIENRNGEHYIEGERRIQTKPRLGLRINAVEFTNIVGISIKVLKKGTRNSKILNKINMVKDLDPDI